MAEGDLAIGGAVFESGVGPPQEKATFLNDSFQKFARTKSVKGLLFLGNGLLTIL